MCSQRIPKICNRQVSGGMVSQPGCRSKCHRWETTCIEAVDSLGVIVTEDVSEYDCFDLFALHSVGRELIQFIVEPSVKELIYTDLKDTFGTSKEGETIGDGYDYEDYKLKVNRYIEEHKDETAIFKLRNNLPLLPADYEALTAILMKDLGNPEDYQREFGDTPLGLLVRKVAKMERDAAMQAFSSFINEQNLNQQQIVFVHKIVDYVVENGYIESIKILMSPPFDKPQSFMRLFNDTERKELIQIINTIRDNAVQTA